ncbi:MAG: hypothetical protein J0L64_13825 [Acidobacteria bacterium]|nr:hypothetical protein [Acidobacteriota bacterium]
MIKAGAWSERGPFAAGALVLLGAWLMRPYGNLGDAANVPWFLAAAGVMGAGFLVGLVCGRVNPAWFWMVALAARIVLFGMTPGHDVYRYLWEGELQNAGYSPYCFAPGAMELGPLRDAHWRMLEHKEVSAIYPPLAEVVFRMVTAVSASVAAMKALFVAADLAVCWLLVRRHGATLALGYAWNPLVIYSFSGGGHYDSLFLLAIVGAIAQWEGGDSAGRRLRGALLLGAGVALKWLSLPLLGWALWRVLRLDGVRRLATVVAAAGAPFAIAWLVVAWGSWGCPLVPGDFTRVARSAEALPALASWLLPPRHILDQNSSYLVIFLAVAAILLLRQAEMPRAAHATLSAALLTTPMFHAWYGTWILPFLPATRSWASVALSLSAFVYFWLHHTVGQPGGIWRQTVWEKLLLWGPFVMGLIVDEWARRRVRKEDMA